MTLPAPLWLALLPKCEDLSKPAGYKRRYCKKVTDLLAVRHPDLHAGKIGAALSEEEAIELVEVLKKNTAGHIVKNQVNYLIRGLEKGVLELGWDAAIPQAPVVIPRDPPRLTYEDFQSLPTLYDIEQAFLSNVTAELAETPSARTGKILLSAVLYGGLVHKRWLTPLIEALCEPHAFATSLWLDMRLTAEHLERERKIYRKNKGTDQPVPKPKPDWEIRRRWFADPITHVLILRWHEMFPADRNARWKPSPLLAIQHYLLRILPATVSITDSLVENLLDGAATRLGLGVSPFLMAYAEGRVKSVPLPSYAWERLLTGKRVVCNEPIEPKDEITPVAEFISMRFASQATHPANQEQLLRKIHSDILPRQSSRKLIPSKVREAFISFYDEHLDRMSPALVCLIFWCIDMLTHYARVDLLRGRVKIALKASSVRTYLGLIGNRLIALAGDLDIAELESDELHDLYGEIVSLCTTRKAQHDVAARLMAFHEFLQARCGGPPVDFSDISVSSGSTEQNVDANLISPAEFDKIKRVLVPNINKVSRMRKMQFFLAILGFRCGLRRSEARKLRLIDFQGYTEPELMIRNNQYAYAKSGESIRRLPLACLLEHDELLLFLQWRRAREVEIELSSDHSLLFCEIYEDTTPLNENELFPPVEEAMRQVTGDRSVRFHHLRHSFATWLTLRLLKDIPSEVCSRYHFLDHHYFSLEKNLKLRATILGNHPLGRKTLFAVAQLCGHASPQVTLLHYFHLCDWLLSQELSLPANQPLLTASDIMQLVQLPQHVVYHARKVKGAKNWQLATFLDRLDIPKEFLSRNALLPMDTSPLPEKNMWKEEETTPLWRRIEVVLRERHSAKIPYNVLANRNSFTESEVRCWCESAARLASMKTRRLNPRHINLASLKQESKEMRLKFKQLNDTSLKDETNKKYNNKKKLNRTPLKEVADCLFPIPPDISADKEMAMNVLNAFHNSKGSQRKKMCEGVVTFINTFFVTGNGVLCKKMADARKYLRFLKLLNIPQQQIHVILELPKTVRRSDTDELKILVSGLGVPPECIRVRDQYLGEEFRVRKLSINVLNTPVGPDDYKYQIKRSNGFRYAMYMLAIMNNLVD